MRLAPALVFAATALGCLPPAAIEPRLHTPPAVLTASEAGAVAIADWTLIAATPPRTLERPHPVDRETTLRELVATLTLRTPSGEPYQGRCLFSGSSGSFAVGPQSAMECRYGVDPLKTWDWTLHLYGRGGRDFFAEQHVTGQVEPRTGPTFAAPEGEAPRERATWAVDLEGSPRLLNFYALRTEWRYTEYLWRSRCCDRDEPIGAIDARTTPIAFLRPEVAEPMRTGMILATATVVAMQRITSVDPPP